MLSERGSARPGDRPVVFVDAATQIENLGDDVILRQLLRLLEARADLQVDVRKVPDWAQEVIAVDPATARDARWFGVRLLATGLRSRLGRGPSRVALVLKPGHIGGSYGFRYGLGRAGLLGLTLACRLLGVTVARVGFSVNDARGALLHLERLQSRAQQLYAPRDDVSISYARSAGIRVNGRSADLAYTLGVTDDGRPRSGLVLSFAGSTDGHVQPAYADQLTAFLRRYLDEAAGPDVTWCAQVVRDATFGDQVLEDRGHVARVAFERDAASAEAVFDLYGGADLVLTNRLHAFLFALSRGALAVVVTDPATHGKIVGIVEDMGLPELLVPLQDLTPERLDAAVAALQRRRGNVLQTVSRYLEAESGRIGALLDTWIGPVVAETPAAADAR